MDEKEILNQLNTAFDVIAKDPFCGIQIPKRFIPEVYITKYGIGDVWTLNFHKNERLIYPVSGDETYVVAWYWNGCRIRSTSEDSGIDTR